MKAFNRGLIFAGNFVTLGGILQGLHGSQWIAGISVVLWIVVGVIMMLVGAVVEWV
jgi:hypothetical protein